jgi:phosphoribosylformylglycinamidine synthase|tara:strand:- start:5187 stop:5441 length:255 start_codon:yes stop_codon:yes gene_type:complete
MKKFSVKIQITPKKAVNDPRGTQVLNGLKNLGYNLVENVSVGKYIELSVNAKNENECETKINEACEQFLANPLIEEYTIKIKSL